MWPYKREQPSTPQFTKRVVVVTASIGCRDKKSMVFQRTYPFGTRVSCIQTYLHLYRWFFEKDSPYFTLQHRDGASVLIRSEITGINLSKEIRSIPFTEVGKV